MVVVRAYSRQLIPYLAVKSNLAGRRKSDRLSFAIEGGMRGISGNPSPPDFQPPRHVLQASSATSDRYKSSPGTVICSGVNPAASLPRAHSTNLDMENPRNV